MQHGNIKVIHTIKSKHWYCFSLGRAGPPSAVSQKRKCGSALIFEFKSTHSVILHQCLCPSFSPRVELCLSVCHFFSFFFLRSSILAELAIQQSRLKEARKRGRDFLTLPPASAGILGLFLSLSYLHPDENAWGMERSRMRGLRWIKPVWDRGNSLYPVVRNLKHYFMVRLYNTSRRHLW